MWTWIPVPDLTALPSRPLRFQQAPLPAAESPTAGLLIRSPGRQKNKVSHTARTTHDGYWRAHTRRKRRDIYPPISQTAKPSHNLSESLAGGLSMRASVHRERTVDPTRRGESSGARARVRAAQCCTFSALPANRCRRYLSRHASSVLVVKLCSLPDYVRHNPKPPPVLPGQHACTQLISPRPQPPLLRSETTRFPSGGAAHNRTQAGLGKQAAHLKCKQERAQNSPQSLRVLAWRDAGEEDAWRYSRSYHSVVLHLVSTMEYDTLLHSGFFCSSWWVSRTPGEWGDGEIAGMEMGGLPKRDLHYPESAKERECPKDGTRVAKRPCFPPPGASNRPVRRIFVDILFRYLRMFR